MGIEDKKFEGGENLNPEQIQSIAVAVKALFDADKEKETVSQQLTEVRKELGEVKGEFSKVKEGMHCDSSGRYCFETPEELNAFIQSQKEKMDGLDGKIGEITTQIKEIGEAGKKASLPGGVRRLSDVTAKIRAGMSKEDNEARDAEVKAIADYFHVSDNDLYRKVEKIPASLDAIAKKGNIRERVLSSLSDGERKKVVLYGCKNGTCKVWRENMEKEEGVRFYLKDERGRFKPVDEPKREAPHI